MLLIDRAKEKYLRWYWRCVFLAKTGQKCTILGKATIINHNVELGENVLLYPNVMLYGNGRIKIGNNVTLGNNVIIYAHERGGVSIGDDTLIAANCYIIDSNHGINKTSIISSQEFDVSRIEIGTDVWLGAGCQVIKGARIDDGAVIGAGSVVNKHIPRYAVAVGVPAKVMRFRT